MTPMRLVRTAQARGLKTQLTAAFVSVAVALTVTASVVSYRVSAQRITVEVERGLESIVTLSEADLNRWVVEQQEKVAVMASALAGTWEVVDAADGARQLSVAAERRVSAALETARGEGHDFRELFVLANPGGRVLLSTDPAHVGAFHVEDAVFLDGIAGTYQPIVYQSPKPDGTSVRPTVTVAVPLREDDGRVSGVIAGHLDLTPLAEMVSDIDVLVSGAKSYLLDESRNFFSADDIGGGSFPRGVNSEGVLALTRGENGVAAYVNHAGEEVIGAYRWVAERRIGLLLEAPRSEALAGARALLAEVFLYGMLATLLSGLLVNRIAARVAAPVEEVNAAATALADGDFTVTVPVAGSSEVRRMGEAFNRMTARLQALYGNLEGQITVTREALEALEESRSLLQSIIDNSGAHILVLGTDGRVILANRAFADLTEVTQGRLEGLHIEDILPAQLRSSGEVSEILAAGAPVQVELDWPVGGERRTLLCSWFPLHTHAVTRFGMGMVATDLTDRKSAEEERLQFEAKIQHAQKLESLGVLAGGIAHDFNNLLAAILGHADLARETRDEPEESEYHLKQVLEAGQKAAELTNQMLAYAGRTSFRVETFDLNEAIRSMSELVTVSMPKKVELELRAAPEPLLIRADPAQISQVAMNLITNAAQSFGDEAGVVTVETGLDPVSGEARLVVRDSGQGMDDETLARIFDPFFTTKEKGRGLGLAAVSGILKGLGGSIDLDSEPGRGTTAVVRLPLAVSASPADVAAEDVPTSAWTGDGQVLVVDDEPGVRMFIAKVLRSKGFEIVEAGDGIEALDYYHSAPNPPRAVVLDMSMPRMGGREVLAELREIDPELPVLFTTGYDPSEAGSAAEGPATRFLQKPYRSDELIEAFRGLLESVERGAPT